MGWCNGTRVFDAVCEALLGDTTSEKAILEGLLDVLEDLDWDCHNESEFWNHPLVQEVMMDRHPEWFEVEG